MKIKGMQWKVIETPIDDNFIIELEVVDKEGNTYFVLDASFEEFDNFYVANESLFDDYFEDDYFEEIESKLIAEYGMENGIMSLEAIQSDFYKIFALLRNIMQDFIKQIILIEYGKAEPLEPDAAKKYIEPLLALEF